MTTVITAENVTSPAERSAKAFGGHIFSTRTDAKKFQTSVDGLNDSVKKFDLAAVDANFSKPIAAKAATVVKATAAIATGFNSTGQTVSRRRLRPRPLNKTRIVIDILTSFREPNPVRTTASQTWPLCARLRAL